MNDTPELSPGARVGGRYEVQRVLGRGAVKVVYLALDVLTRAPVAVAVLHPRPGADPTLGPRFSREARAASALRSPHVVRVLDVGKMDDGTRYMVSEAVLGRGLDEVIAYGAAPAMPAAIWTTEVLEGLIEAHARGILHRDVKPENVLLDPAADHPVGERAKLTDFGLAKVLDNALEGSVVLRTAQGVVMGTADYMSPEQWAGGPVDPRSDLYSTGAMFYELLTGRAPFHASTLREICAGHAIGVVPPFAEHVTAAARAFEPVVRRALAKRAADRFQGADEMRAAIEQVGGFALRAHPAPAEPDDGPFVRAELVTDVGVGPVQLVTVARAVLGRTGHVVLRCVPLDNDNDRRSRTISRRHARIEWRGGAPMLRDLGSVSGTFVNGQPLSSEDAVALATGDVIAVGPHVRLRYDQSATEHGVLPRWARLTRIDAYGRGLLHLLVLHEADIADDADAAIELPRAIAHGERVRVVAAGKHFEVVDAHGARQVISDGATVRLGEATIGFAIEGVAGV
jgi:hypothetical protein